jgi:hypothetical protein
MLGPHVSCPKPVTEYLLSYSIEIHFCIHIVSGLFSDAVSNHVSSNGRIMNDRDVEGIGHDVIGGIIQEFAWRD